MRYTLIHVSGSARRVFKEDTIYDDRDIVRLAGRAELRVTRPNGDARRIRGSSRLHVYDGRHVVAKFEQQRVEEKKAVRPEQVALIRGKLI